MEPTSYAEMKQQTHIPSPGPAAHYPMPTLDDYRQALASGNTCMLKLAQTPTHQLEALKDDPNSPFRDDELAAVLEYKKAQGIP